MMPPPRMRRVGFFWASTSVYRSVVSSCRGSRRSTGTEGFPYLLILVGIGGGDHGGIGGRSLGLDGVGRHCESEGERCRVL